jgi:hypothetical protein
LLKPRSIHAIEPSKRGQGDILGSFSSSAKGSPVSLTRKNTVVTIAKIVMDEERIFLAKKPIVDKLSFPPHYD